MTSHARIATTAAAVSVQPRRNIRVLVAVKRVIDFAVKVRVKADKSAVETTNVKMSMNPFCEIAVEEAVRLKEKKIATEIVAVSIGPKQCAETLRIALALGCDRAIHVESDLRTDQDLQPLAVSKALAHVVGTVKPTLVFMGKQAIDSDNSQTPAMLAGLLNWPLATQASKIVLNDAKTVATVTREVDAGLQTLELPLPAVISADLRLNEPRFASLPNIMAAKKKPLETLKLDAVGLSADAAKPRLQVLAVTDPPVRKAGVKVADVAQLVSILKEKGFSK